MHAVRHALRPPPIFQIGFNKCGTTSLHRFLTDSGIPSVHWKSGDMAKRMMARIDAGQDPIRDFPNTIAFTDTISLEPGRLLEPYKRFDYLHSWYPNALFILNTRDREGWIASRAGHQFGSNRLIARYAECLAISEAEVPDFWRAEWDAHHSLARAYFRSSPQFLEFHIERDHPDRLRQFLGRRYPQCLDTPFGNHNQRENSAVPAVG
jgi:hypothetical protein